MLLLLLYFLLSFFFLSFFLSFFRDKAIPGCALIAVSTGLPLECGGPAAVFLRTHSQNLSAQNIPPHRNNFLALAIIYAYSNCPARPVRGILRLPGRKSHITGYNEGFHVCVRSQ